MNQCLIQPRLMGYTCFKGLDFFSVIAVSYHLYYHTDQRISQTSKVNILISYHGPNFLLNTVEYNSLNAL